MKKRYFKKYKNYLLNSNLKILSITFFINACTFLGFQYVQIIIFAFLDLWVKIHALELQKVMHQKRPPEVFLQKGVLKICSKFTGEHPWSSVILIKLLRSFIEITLRHGCSPANLLHIFRTPFYKNTSGGLLFVYVSEFEGVFLHVTRFYGCSHSTKFSPFYYMCSVLIIYIYLILFVFSLISYIYSVSSYWWFSLILFIFSLIFSIQSHLNYSQYHLIFIQSYLIYILPHLICIQSHLTYIQSHLICILSDHIYIILLL